MSGEPSKDKGAKAVASKAPTKFECAEEAAALLNCIADKNYNEMKCLALMKKLRACTEKKRVVDFTLLPEDGAQPASSQQ